MTPKRVNKNQINALSVMRYLAAHGPSTQIQTTHAVNLRRTSVFNVFESMEQAKLLEMSSNIANVGKGRPRQLWQLNGSLGAFVSIYTNTHDRVVQLSDFNGLLLENITASPHESMGEELREIVGMISEWSKKYRILGVIVLLPGRVDFEQGVVLLSKSWEMENYPLREILRERLSRICPDALVLIENNARMTAWGQRCGGACIGIDDFMTLSILDGRRNGKTTPISIGSGIVLDGRVYRGRTGGAGELDHNCYTWWNRIYSEDKFPISLQEIDRESREYFAGNLGESFAHLVNYLEPERLVVVFEQQPAEDFFMAFRKALYKHLIYIDKSNFHIELSSDGTGSTIRGGLALLRETFFAEDHHLIELCSQL